MSVATVRPRASKGAVGLRDAAEMLGVHYMTVYRYVRTGRLDATLVGDVWSVQRSTIQEFERIRARPSAPQTTRPRGVGDHAKFVSRLQKRMLAGDEVGAWQVIESAMASGSTPSDVYLKLLTPALVEIGERWHDGTLTIADEHIASAVAGRLIGRLGPRFATRGHRRATVILGSAPGDRHAFPTAILADLLRGQGFHAIDLGPDTPEAMFARTIHNATKLCAVAISASTKESAAQVRSVVAAVRGTGFDGMVAAGGSAIDSRLAARRRGADDWANDGAGLIALVETAAGRSGARAVNAVTSTW